MDELFQIPLTQLALKSGPIALILLGSTALMSIVSWGIIFSKTLSSQKESTLQKRWKKQWSNTPSLHSLQSLAYSFPKSARQRIAQAAIIEIKSLKPNHSYQSLSTRKAIIEESLDRVIESEVQRNQGFLSTLSLFSSIAPFLGLLGTVWGIMHSFLEIGEQSSASLNVVAPGIAEALVTTIAGLLVAIPASAAYYFFTNINRKTEVHWYQLGSEILSLFQKQDLLQLENSQNPSNSQPIKSQF